MANNNFDRDTDWQDVMTRTGRTNNFNLSISGGSENSTYYISGNYTNEEGILVGTAMDRYSLRANSEFKVTDFLKIGESIAVSRLNVDDQAHYTQGNPWITATVASPYMPVYSEENLGGFGGPTDTLTGNNERTNPFAEQMLNEQNYYENRVMSSVFADIKFFEGLTYTLKLGLNVYNTQRTLWSPEYALGNLRLRDNDVSKLEERNNNNVDYLITNLLTYEASLSDHNFKVIAAYERAADHWEYNNAVGRYITNPNLPVLDQAEEAFSVTGGEGDHRLESILGRLIYDYRGKYLLTASIRRDGSTRFGPEGGRYGNFPSFSLGWKVNEDFLNNVQEINMLKLRLGWGQTGNENIRDYEYFSQIDPLRNSRYIFGSNQDLYLGGAPTSYQANPMIKWEAAEMTNIGVDLNAFNNRLLLTAEYYVKNQNDMLVRKAISTTFGKYVFYGGAGDVGAWVNLGKVQNRGFEFDATWRKLEGNFRYSINANFSTLKNEVFDLGENNDIITDYTITTVGHTIGSFFGLVAERILQVDDFLQDENGNLVVDGSGNYTLLHAEQEDETAPGDIKFRDTNQDGKINNLDKVVIGKSLPDFIYGINFELQYKGIDFTLFLQGMQNMDVYNNHMSRIGLATDRYGKDENKLVEVMDYWTVDNPSTTQTRVTVVDENQNSRVSTWFLEDASFLRVKTVQLGYNLPSRWIQRIGVSNLRIYASANNLYTFTKYKGFDPEVGDDDPLNNGVDNGYYPVPRTTMFGIQLGF
jgi:TonB-linked SusC/RagA family outer membrane protein